MNKKSKKEQLFIFVVLFTLSILVVCLTGCSGSCLGCSVGCDGNSNIDSVGLSYVADGCCSDSSCKTACGQIRFDYDEEIDGGTGTTSEIGSGYFAGCTTSSSSCSGESYDYSGVLIGTGSTCGACRIAYGSNEMGVGETNIDFEGGCVSCTSDWGNMGPFYEFIYEWLGI